ncbi:MAG: SpoIID/LytB domain-containing protein [Chloroflexota bacterium]|nr:SpoIID/LytB domain-containing protein [Chloroflexota bacterium]
MSRASRCVTAALVVASVCVPLAGVPPAPALAAPALALPSSIRVNVAPSPTSYAVISSSGTATATAPDGRILYRGPGRTLSRTNVRRVADLGGQELPSPTPGALTAEERADRASILREARVAARDPAAHGLVTVPFEFSLLRDDRDAVGAVALSGDRVVGVRFTAADGLLQFNGRSFRGALELALDDEGDMIVVNDVATQDYLASVVGAEMPAAWTAAALGAQAIAARTYLLTHLRRHSSYDLEGDTRDQAYDGTKSEAESTRRAVQRTAGVVATYRGAAIEALYSANAGGITEDSENVFANALPYLRSVASPGDEIAKDVSWGSASWAWTKEVTAPQLRDYLAARDFDVGEPKSIDLTQVSASGRVLVARVTGTLGTREIGKDRTRYYFGLRSTLFSVALRPGGDTEYVDAANADRLRALEALGAAPVGAAYRRIVGRNRETDEPRILGYTFQLPGRFVFSGRGFGHGVGMSQWGAEAMARGGASSEQILTHYYRGIQLTAVGGG